MGRYASSVVNLLIDRKPDELIGAILLALILSLLLSGVYSVWRRKASDPTLLLTCLALVVNLVGMILAGGLVNMWWEKAKQQQPPVRSAFMPGDRPPMPPGEGRSILLARRIVEAADADHNGEITPEEAAAAAAAFIRQAEKDVGHTLDEPALRDALRGQLGPPPGYGPPMLPPGNLPDLSPAVGPATRPADLPPAGPSDAPDGAPR